MRSLPTNSLERALIILKFIGEHPDGLTNRDLSRSFNLARSTCSYILRRMENEGYLVRNHDDGRYRIGLSTLVLGRNALRAVRLQPAVLPALYRLAMNTGLAANLAVLEQHRVIITDRIEGPAFVKAAMDDAGRPGVRNGLNKSARAIYLNRKHLDVGDELPIRTSALGKLFLAHMPPDELNCLLAKCDSSNEILENANAPEMLGELEAIRKNGYCMMAFEPHNESCSLAAPVFDEANKLCAAVSVSCRRHLPIWNDERALSEVVKEAAWEISCQSNYWKSLRDGNPQETRIVDRRIRALEDSHGAPLHH